MESGEVEDALIDLNDRYQADIGQPYGRYAPLISISSSQPMAKIYDNWRLRYPHRADYWSLAFIAADETNRETLLNEAKLTDGHMLNYLQLPPHR